MKKSLSVVVAMMVVAAVTGCANMYGKGKAPPPVVQTNG
jgi:predicted small lipoprotein YifL